MTKQTTPPGEYWTIEYFPPLDLSLATPTNVQFYVMDQDQAAPNRDALVTWQEILDNIPPSGLTAVEDDLAPVLGGSLDVANFQIVSTAGRNIRIIPDGAGLISLEAPYVSVEQAEPAASALGTSRTYLDSTSKRLRFSEDNGAYRDLVGNPLTQNLAAGGFNITGVATMSASIVAGAWTGATATASTSVSTPVITSDNPAVDFDSKDLSNIGLVKATTLDAAVYIDRQVTEPADPALNSSVRWLSDGTGTNSVPAGNWAMKINTGGTIKVYTLVDNSL